VKDNVGIIGYDSTIGISKFISQPATEDAAIVIALKRLGAIPFCKTNIPQTNMRLTSIFLALILSDCCLKSLGTCAE
jgi:Asp-tRNA(Asn)/Glu-tRNA(Gln) amidotransferase A subunit family amidase